MQSLLQLMAAIEAENARVEVYRRQARRKDASRLGCTPRVCMSAADRRRFDSQADSPDDTSKPVTVRFADWMVDDVESDRAAD